MKIILSLTTFLLIISCISEKREPVDSFNGYWQSVGYGELLKINQDSFQRMETTTISCLPVKTGSLSSLGKSVERINDTLVVTMGTGVYHYTKSDSLSSICTKSLSTEKAEDPIYNFEVFAQTIAQHYAFFERNSINWDSLYQASKSKVHPKITDPELYLVMESIVDHINDNHGYIEPSEKVYQAAELLHVETTTETNSLPEYGDFQIAQMATTSFLEEELTKDSWLMQWGKLRENTGYLQVKSMWLYADLELNDSIIKESGYIDAYVTAFSKLTENDYIEKEQQGASKLMDMVMGDLYNTDTLIIDIRFNGGGQDLVSLEILKRFNNERRKIATKKAINAEGFTPEIPIYMDAANEPYLKPVFVLTSPQTGSAADFFALATLELPHVKRIGSHSSGALSDALEKQLPNGWLFSVSNEIYEDLNGKCYENIGVPVHFDLGYAEDRQSFFRYVANNLEADKTAILTAMQN